MLSHAQIVAGQKYEIWDVITDKDRWPRALPTQRRNLLVDLGRGDTAKCAQGRDFVSRRRTIRVRKRIELSSLSNSLAS